MKAIFSSGTTLTIIEMSTNDQTSSSMSRAPTIRIGILSTANIGKAVLGGIKSASIAKCTAIASRDVEKAQEYADKQGIQHAMTYEEMLESDEVDAVYIPLPTALSTEWAVRAAQAKKHVLVDKPFASKEAVQSIIDACKEADVIFLDGTHFVHSSRTKRVRKLIEDGCIGDVRSIYAPFQVPVPRLKDDIRGNPELEPYGVLGDVTWYSIRAAVSFLGTDIIHKVKDTSVIGAYHPTVKGVLSTVQGTVRFEGVNGEVTPLVFSNDFVSSLYQKVIIVGKIGQIEIPEFVIPHAQTFFFDDVRSEAQFSTDVPFVIEKTVSHIHGEDDFRLKYPSKQTVFIQEDHGYSQIAKMIKEFCRLIHHHDLERAEDWAKQTLLTQTTLDEIHEKLTISS